MAYISLGLNFKMAVNAVDSEGLLGFQYGGGS